MWWLIVFLGAFSLLLAAWRQQFWLAGYGLVATGLLLVWQLDLVSRLAPLLPGLYVLTSGLFWLIGYLFWRFARRLIRQHGEHLAYRALQLVALLLLALPLVTLWWPSQLLRLLWLSVGYFSAGWVAYVLGSLLLVLYPQSQVPATIIVLGSGLRPDGQLSLTLAYRVRQAARLYQRYGCQLVVSGGQGADEPWSEAQAMATALQQMGVPAAALILETRSTSTWENLQLSVAKLSGTTLGLLTSNFHLLRAALYAQRLPYQWCYYAAPTPLSYIGLGALRDYLALLVLTRWWQFGGWLLVLALGIWY